MPETRLSLRRAAGEFAVIVLGVLVALAADAWNDRRLDRAEEREYLERLHTALQEDTAQYQFILNWMDRKEAGLRRVDELLSSPTAIVQDSEDFASHLAAAQNFGWNVGPLGARATFEDLRSSGKLGLLREVDLRNRLIEYYGRTESEDRRIEARRTDFPRIAYRFVPAVRTTEPGRFGASERVGVKDPNALLQTLRASALSDHVQAELNRTLFIRGSISDLQTNATQLLEEISQALTGSP